LLNHKEPKSKGVARQKEGVAKVRPGRMERREGGKLGI
jgi:hypothetical protein